MTKKVDYFIVFFTVLCFNVSPSDACRVLCLPVFFHNLNVLALVVTFTLFTIRSLGPGCLLSGTFFLVVFHSILTPVVTASFCDGMLCQLRRGCVCSLSRAVATASPLSSAHCDRSLGGTVARKRPCSRTTRLTAGSLCGALRRRDLLLTLGRVLNCLLIVSIIVTIVSHFVPFRGAVHIAFGGANSSVMWRGGDYCPSLGSGLGKVTALLFWRYVFCLQCVYYVE